MTNLKAIPHKDCASDAKSDFSLDCTKSTQACWSVDQPTEINFSKQFVINYELLKYKSLGQAFSKACGVQRQSLGRSSQWAKSPVQTAKLSNHKANCQRSWQFAFVRRALRKGWMLKIIQWIIFNRGGQHFIKSMIWFEMPMQGWRPASEGVP